MSNTTRVMAMVLVLCTVASILCGCTMVKSTDEHLTKGEFMLLFAYEIGLSPSENPTIKLNVDKKYEDAAIALVEVGYLTEKEASSNLDKAVKKEFVASLCIKNLYFRKNHEITLKDASKLSDPQACQDAVGHGIVSAENGYFDANDKMTYSQCQKAIDRMMHIDATSSFKKEDAVVECKLKDGVIDITDYADEMELKFISPDSEEGKAIIERLQNSVVPVSADSSVFSGKYNVVRLNKVQDYTVNTLMEEYNIVDVEDAQVGDHVLVSANKTLRVLEVNDIFVNIPSTDEVNPFYSHLTSLGGIVKAVDKQYLKINYVVEVASPEVIAEYLKIDNFNAKENNVEWNISASKDMGNGIEIRTTANGFEIEIKKTFDTAKVGDTWRDPHYKIDADYTFKVQDIDLDVSGFGDIFDGNIDNAVCKLSYNIVNDLTLTSKNRITPDNNGNGKFPSNLRRSRLTASDSKGATRIKIGKIEAPIYAGIGIIIDIDLIITLDGQLHIVLTTPISNGFRIVNNKLMKLEDPEAEASRKVEGFANAEMGVRFLFTATFLKCRIVDFGITGGLGVDCYASVEMILSDGTEYKELGYIPKDVIDVFKADAKCNYELSGRLYIFFRMDAFTEKCAMGKILKKAKIKFEYPSWEFTIFEWGLSVEGDKETPVTVEEEVEANTSNDEEFRLTTYKVVLPEYTCALLEIIEIPVKTEALNKMGGLHIYTKDANIATARLLDGKIIVEAINDGSTELIVETANKRFTQACSITVTPPSYDESNIDGAFGNGGGGGFR